MDSDILVGAASVAVAAVLLWIGMPDKSGISPRFLRFEIAPLIYPTVILAIFEEPPTWFAQLYEVDNPTRSTL